ncbi:nitrite/sulfite reductase [Geomobilimonas luticola]|uniref:Nitrite/sulfite reductase n=1 Tax=Geomobilimonas luticola TaxID=1114878 RepID=A0ABS5SII0_9BACT|nr:nitrite/sulfite reductase [Geomobilimonas luticola]MBT0654571.1 nitrite/sulfite reductase [Geomobilimonas luticola]
MTTHGTEYRLDGIYRQRQEGYFMQRVKLPAGAISALQARAVAEIAEQFGRGLVHLTVRGSMEIHWIGEGNLPDVKKALGRAGLTSRGACGGAVRGVTCNSQGTAGFPVLENLARRLHRHFTGNPRFERLPKKFKIGIEADRGGKRHLIQDVGLVLVRTDQGQGWYDVWIAGGLGREPREGFLLAEGVAETRLIPLIETILRVYAAHTPPGKRLKHLVREIGRDELLRRIEADPSAHEELPPVTGLPESLVPGSRDGETIEVPFFAGEIQSDDLRTLADIADTRAGGMLMVTGAQNMAVTLPAGSNPEEFRNELTRAGFTADRREEKVTFRICPGSHECIMGLTPTRDAARKVVDAMGPAAESLSWALSGCQNSCSQPQLADIGIVSSRLVAGDDGQRTPRFDIYRSRKEGLGEKTAEGLDMDALLAEVRQLG